MSQSRSSRLGVIVLAALCVGLGVALERLVLSADSTGQPPTYLARLASDLDLSPEQISSIERVLDEEDRTLRELRDEHAEAMRAPVVERRQVTEEAILAFLGEEQRSRYAALTTR